MLQEQTDAMLPLMRMASAPGGAAAGAVHHDARYAIYFAPRPDSAWWRFGCAWLGRDAVADAPVAQPDIGAFDAATVARITATPRHYGFHATLKAPFRLKPEYTARHVYVQAENLAASLANTPSPRLPPLTLRAMTGVRDGFVALGFAADQSGSEAAHLLAAQCVSSFDYLRALPHSAELARRRVADLSPRQGDLLVEWGYPYVFDEFRFHLTLTGSLPAAMQAQVIAALTPWIDTLNAEPLALDAIAVYVQLAPDAPFVVTRRYGFDGCVEIYRDSP